MTKKAIILSFAIVIFLFIHSKTTYAENIDDGVEDFTAESSNVVIDTEDEELVEENKEDSIEETETPVENDTEYDSGSTDSTDEKEEVVRDNQEEHDNVVESESDHHSADEVESKEQVSQEIQENVTNEVLSKQDTDLIEKEQKTYKLGDRNVHLIRIKEKLNAVGFDRISETNYFGSWTETRVKQFQANYGLGVTGVLDEKTLSKLDEVYNSPFQLGGKSSQIIDLKEKLNAIGFNGISLTANYGSWTETRVKQFQRHIGLKDNGIADAYTRLKLDEFLKIGFQAGDRHSSIVDLKVKLNKLGFNGIAETNYFGSWTKKRLTEFQTYYGLKATGTANIDTLKLLDEIANTPFQEGVRNEATKQLKKDLNSLGFGKITVSTLYGSFTKKQVSNFQKYYGLKVNGIADTKTLAKIEEIIKSPFRKGVRSEKTIQLKEKLNRLGFGYITVTTLYGSFTEKQVRKFQQHYGLRVTGIVDNKTNKKIDELINSPLQKGKHHKDVIPVKQKLNALGYDGIAVTDLFGSWTEKRLKQFQKDYGLPVSGIADKETVKALENSSVTIFIDPGHGGSDPGASGYSLKEKSVVLDIALRVGEVLSSKYRGVVVDYSRQTDTFIPLEERANKANNGGADYFVSLHLNASNGQGKGFETYIYNGKVTNETIRRQNDIHSYLIDKINIMDRGMKQANFSVLRNTNMPALLIEYMFIDNKAENQKLSSKQYRNWLGEITADAIAKSFGLKKK
ncbi:peptidoglycan-binding protein [Ornithinibacillus sp. JPR2-1]|uniref:peptidoglycan-binding protein n=1 Tax=Ornithinibacillus sp. JPR2-1 TaxID=2094019 RepID=UPI0031D4A140